MRRLLLALGILTFLPLLGFSADAVAADKKNDKQDEKKAKNEKPRLAVFRLNSPVTELPATRPFRSARHRESRSRISFAA